MYLNYSMSSNYSVQVSAKINIYSCFSVIFNIFNRRNVLLKITPQCSSLRWLYLDEIPSVENFHTQTCKIMGFSSLFWLPRVPKHIK